MNANWVKGVSGNPRGRPPKPGVEVYRKSLRKQALRLIDKTVELALEGNVAALKLLLDKILPSWQAEAPGQRLSLSGETLGERAHNVLTRIEEGALSAVTGGALIRALIDLQRLAPLEDPSRLGDSDLRRLAIAEIERGGYRVLPPTERGTNGGARESGDLASDE